jgi:hypothetical protein
LGQIVRVEVRDRDNPYKQYDQRLISLYRVLVDGEIREFLGWDVELISE